MKLKRWWFFFVVWSAAEIFAVAYPLAGPRGMIFFHILIWTLAASVPGQVVVIITAFNWRKLSPAQRCLGLGPLPGLLLPFAIFAF